MLTWWIEEHNELGDEWMSSPYYFFGITQNSNNSFTSSSACMVACMVACGVACGVLAGSAE